MALYSLFSSFNKILNSQLDCQIKKMCTLQALTVTSFCEVPEHNLSLVYNLTKLSSNKDDIIIKHDHPISETIRMQLCSPLVKKCNNQDGYAICLIKDNIEKGIGNFAKS